MNGKEYLKSLGFETIFIGAGIIGSSENDFQFPEHIESAIYVNFDRKTALVWESGYDVNVLLGKGLTDAEEKELQKIDGLVT